MNYKGKFVFVCLMNDWLTGADLTANEVAVTCKSEYVSNMVTSNIVLALERVRFAPPGLFQSSRDISQLVH